MYARVLAGSLAEEAEPQDALVADGIAAGGQRARHPVGGAAGVVRVGQQREREKRSIHLDREWASRLKPPRFLHGNQCAKLRIVVLQEELAVRVADHCVAPRYGNVSDADVALVAAPKLQRLLPREGQYMQTSSCMLLRISYHVLQHDERPLRGRHLHQGLCLALRRSDVCRVGCLAELAGKRPVEVRAARVVREVQAPLDPVPQAPKVHVLDRAFALAGRNERVVGARALQEANATGAGRDVRFGAGAADGTDVIQPQLRLSVRLLRAHELPHAELESAQLDHVALGELVGLRRKLTHHQPEFPGVARGRGLVDPEAAVALHQPEQGLAARVLLRGGVPAQQLDLCTAAAAS
mmetsp:Transcript_94489/g.294315  ORF Transcript_94489/g.294315 Transcript_94489/m.294315 type:complete len:353 (+) Transcript_94489:223-1281(+)